MPSVNIEAVPNYSRMLRLDGQAFVLLGAGQGIGKHVAHALAQSGARLLCVDSDADRAHAVAALTEGQPYVADITKRAEMQGLFQHAQVQFGSDLKGLVDVVGMVGDGGLNAKEDRPWRRQFELVLDHAWLALQYGASAMASHGGAMVFIGSEAGNILRTGTRLPYSAAKAALTSPRSRSCAGAGIRSHSSQRRRARPDHDAPARAVCRPRILGGACRPHPAWARRESRGRRRFGSVSIVIPSLAHYRRRSVG